MNILDFCFPFLLSNQEDKVINTKLQSNPIPIFWWRKCNRNNVRASSSSTKDSSPFPREWSVTYSGNSELFSQEGTDKQKFNLQCITDESSVYSTTSQEHRAKRDQFGNCKFHPQIKLARIKHTNLFSRFIANATHRGEEWLILCRKCPECEKEKERRNSAQRQAINVKPDRSSASSQLFNIALYTPIPASITLITSHPEIEGTGVLRITTEPIPIETIQSISCLTPDGVLDYAIPCDSIGNLLQESGCYEYQMLERYIPLTSIDHVSRGGDAWDVLRQSTGEDDLGCRCDVKIHGFSDRLLRFDVVNFDEGDNSKRTGGIRYSFAIPDFMKSSNVAATKNSKANYLVDQEGKDTNQNYSIDKVISDLNSIVSIDRQRRKSGFDEVMNNISLCLNNLFGLGTPI